MWHKWNVCCPFSRACWDARHHWLAVHSNDVIQPAREDQHSADWTRLIIRLPLLLASLFPCFLHFILQQPSSSSHDLTPPVQLSCFLGWPYSTSSSYAPFPLFGSFGVTDYCCLYDTLLCFHSLKHTASYAVYVRDVNSYKTVHGVLPVIQWPRSFSMFMAFSNCCYFLL